MLDSGPAQRSSRYVLLLARSATSALLFLLMASAAAAAERFEQGLLWRIEVPGAASSYLFGTMHSDDPGVVRLAAPVSSAFERSQALVLEVTLDEQSLLAVSAALVFGEGRTLASVVGPDLFRRSVLALAEQGLPESLVMKMKPWAVAVTLMKPPTGDGEVLDHALYRMARSAGKPVSGLETVAEQIAVFEGLALQDQVTLLRDTLDNREDIQLMLAALRQAWLQRDLERLMKINEASLKDVDPELAAMFRQRVIDDRNHVMAQRMEAALRAGNRFIAVGALHLPGRHGLLQLLSERGYRVTPLY